ncbi:L-type lectin-domain containing receptor kinase IX.1-like [Triticum dicoccoides]|uniref:L-type lectin-domain containing receptor kinase IX.1-like n=1 Tax=Triticum dicoccoides TaxID=85692 RepID=UPI0018902BF7|nr:L-type lectin-domain containing receptor kinase IX.1-like [Triticum dicoccoides]
MGSPASSGNTPCCHLLLLLFICLQIFVANSLDASAPAPATAATTPSPFSFSFDFSNASTYHIEDLKFEGDATVHGDLVDLTCNSYKKNPNSCTGRVSYRHPVPFYDNVTGEVASFQARFTFVIHIDDDTKNNKGDGMTFFLASYPSTMPPNSGGGNLGMMPLGKGKNPTAFGNDRFIAVEFDTYDNSWDPNTTYDHIGIDISSIMDSVNTTILDSFSLNGTMTATVTFDNTTRMLVADLQFDDQSYNLPVRVTTQLPDPVTLLPPQVAIGFSGATGASLELHQILSWSFNSSLAPPHKDHDMKAAIIGGSLGGAVALVVMVWCIIACFKWTRSTSHDLVAQTGGPRRFDYRDLASATDNFSKQRVIGRGAFGEVYRGTFSKGLSSGAPSRESGGFSSKESCASSSKDSGTSLNSKESYGGEVAVKKILNKIRGGNQDFFTEMNTISEAKHRNLVKLKGWCCRDSSPNILDFMCWCCMKKKDEELFLVYELVPNGNLHHHLHETEQPIQWPTRYQIIKDIGSALVYLHHDCAPPILHRDIKPGNILLDNNFNAKLADFGLSRIGNQDNVTLMTTAVGTEGYIDPECRKAGKVKFNLSSDVYSFGIVLLDITCMGKSREQVWDLYVRGRVMEAADDRLHGCGDSDMRQMERVAILGLWCSLPDSRKRPTSKEAMEVLERGVSLPDLNHLLNTTSVPSSMQQDTYTTSSSGPQAPTSDESPFGERHA